ncbi:uncharacterized protein LOC128227067 [Mya arenaria]|uniref:uncharacterized protein LOC128227067 n=1 Tax=Mya arenaria TaxID=6604 RepID=UPI0022E4A3AC|nr:uncharacterized protein LOC128227067 [Mya arenaria]
MQYSVNSSEEAVSCCSIWNACCSIKTHNDDDKTLATNAEDIYSDPVERQPSLSEITTLRQENNELRKRLSRLVSAQLTNNNPNIVDLSDNNRPTKLAEQYSELYDNAWTECYECLTKTLSWQEQRTVLWIRNLFLTIFESCCKRAKDDLEEVHTLLQHFQPQPNIEMMKQLKEDRKKTFRTHLDRIKHKLLEDIRNRFSESVKAIDLSRIFINESIELCWLMVIQDPPVWVDTDVDIHGQAFDYNRYKPYTVNGKLVDYVVWPAMFLHERGPLLFKGVAQGTNTPVKENNSSMNINTGTDDIKPV